MVLLAKPLTIVIKVDLSTITNPNGGGGGCPPLMFLKDSYVAAQMCHDITSYSCYYVLV
jgi:hypothetical protein